MADTAREKLVAKEVLYCGVCAMPPEYCEFSGIQGRCRKWLKDNHPEVFEIIYNKENQEKLGNLSLEDEAKVASDTPTPTGDQRTVVKDRSVQLEARAEIELRRRMASKVLIKRIERTKRKHVTAVHGLEVFDIDLKKAAKMFANKFACGSSVSKNNQSEEEIVVQGDFSDEIYDLIIQNWPNIPEDNIDCIEDKPKKKQ